MAAPRTAFSSRPAIIWCVAALAGATLLAYSGSFRVPFLFDDVPAIVNNASIRDLSALREVLSPPTTDGNTVGGRPLVNLSLALNYAAGQLAPGGYHAVNILIHALGALALFGIVRRTLSTAGSNPRLRDGATAIALAAAGLWSLHPLQTESVAYVVQRAESLMGLFYLTTLYAFIRGSETSRPRWFIAATLTCACGMATKEVMVTAPIVVLLYDRTFISGSFREALRRHGKAHAALFATWGILAFLVLETGSRGETIGASSGISWWGYALCQSRAVWRYLWLSFWPHPLIFDYGHDFVSLPRALPFLVVDLVAIAATAIGLWRGRRWAFLSACFLGILAPSSSVVGGTRQMLAEHRMYLSLAPVVIGVVCATYLGLRRKAFVLLAIAGLACGVATVARVQDYSSDLTIWRDTAAKRPDNAMAHGNYGVALINAGRPNEALEEFKKALVLNPLYADAHNNLGNLLYQSGQVEAAIVELTAAVKLKPNSPEGHANLGTILIGTGNTAAGIEHLRKAVELRPNFADAHNNLGIAYLGEGRLQEAMDHATIALQVSPGSAEAHNTRGVALTKMQRYADAAVEFEKAVELDPQYKRAERNLANIRALLQREGK